MNGEKDLAKLLKNMEPHLHKGDYVFCTLKTPNTLDYDQIICFFREAEGTTLILKKETADEWQLQYTYVASWITLTVHSSLEAVGLTAAFSKALAEGNISCNVVAGYYHDHIFVDQKDAEKAMQILRFFAN
jgi:uncharacterized protein